MPSPLAIVPSNDHLQDPIMFNHQPERWTCSHEKYELKMFETPLDSSTCAYINPYDVVLDEAIRKEDMRMGGLDQLVEQSQDDEAAISIYKSLMHLERRMHLTHESARHDLRDLGRKEQERLELKRIEHQKSRKQRKAKGNGNLLRREILKEHYSFEKQEPVPSEYGQATEADETSQDLLAESRREVDYHPFDQLRDRVLRRILEERVKAKADEKEIREKIRQSSSNIVTYPEHVIRYQEKRKEQAKFEENADYEECEGVKNEIRASVRRKRDEKDVRRKAYQMARLKFILLRRNILKRQTLPKPSLSDRKSN
jgi:hypothetical protein